MDLNHPLWATQLPGELCFFVIGALVYYYYFWFKLHRHWMWIAAIVSYAISLRLGWIGFRAAGVGFGVMCAGLLLPCFRGPTKYGDFSYGIYVLHFPVIQAFISLGIVTAYPALALVGISISVGIMAVASWYFVEKPSLAALRLKNVQTRLIDAEDAGKTGRIDSSSS